MWQQSSSLCHCECDSMVVTRETYKCYFQSPGPEAGAEPDECLITLLSVPPGTLRNTESVCSSAVIHEFLQLQQSLFKITMLATHPSDYIEKQN